MSTVEDQIAALRELIRSMRAAIVEYEADIAKCEADIFALEHPPVAPEPLPETIATHHDPKIPILGHDFDTYVAQSGAWSDPKTWSPIGMPGTDSRVVIQKGAEVTMDGAHHCDTLVVQGKLRIENPLEKENAIFIVTTWTVMPEGEVTITGPVEVIFRNAPPDPVADPGQYGGGLLCFGTFTVNGKPKAAYATLESDIRAGENFFSLKTAPQGWEVGDECIFHDCRQLGQKERALGYAQIERRTIQDLSPGEVGFTKSFVFDHKAARDDDGKLDVFPRVANLTRNVVFRAEVPGTSHVMFTSHPKADIRYAAFIGMGRTLNEAISATNIIGRYPLHCHHLHTPVHFEGLVIDGGTEPHDRKWGIVIHATSYSTIKDCVVVNAMGAGIVTEDGSEWGNVFEGNTVIGVDGDGGRADAAVRQGGVAMQGSGIYLRGPGNIVRNNYVANCRQNYAFILNFFYLGDVEYRAAPGSHDLIKVNGNAVGLAGFEGNIAFANKSGLTWWWCGTKGAAIIPGAKETIVKGFTSANHWEYGIFSYQNYRLTLDGYKTRGDKTALGLFGSDYTAVEFKMLNPDIQGQRTGWSVSANGGPQLMVGGIVSAASCVNLNPPWTNGFQAIGILPRDVTIDGTILKGKALISRIFPATLGDRTINLIVLDRVFVKNWQGKAGDNFKVYYDPQQGPGFKVPASIPNLKYGGMKVLGSPEGKMIAGELAPCTTKRAGVLGWCCP
jgi:hypothetical protein